MGFKVRIANWDELKIHPPTPLRRVNLELEVDECLHVGADGLINHENHEDADDSLNPMGSGDEAIAPFVFEVVAEPMGDEAEQHHEPDFVVG